ncbi:MAG: hypothetical protein RMY34_03905, partial [Aulosira sp. DedQUE10]|nr:hypothetical protein [Aulosira sp. DedQUE10]
VPPVLVPEVPRPEPLPVVPPVLVPEVPRPEPLPVVPPVLVPEVPRPEPLPVVPPVLVPEPVLLPELPEELPPEEPLWAEADIPKGTAAKLRANTLAKTTLDKFKRLMVMVPYVV